MSRISWNKDVQSAHDLTEYENNAKSPRQQLHVKLSRKFIDTKTFEKPEMMSLVESPHIHTAHIIK